MFRNIITNILYILGLILLGYVLGVYLGRPSDFVEPLDKEEIDSVLVKKEQEKIDSLMLVIEDYKKLSSSLKDSIEVITITRTVKIDEINNLPLDSGVLFLRYKLREFEDRFK